MTIQLFSLLCRRFYKVAFKAKRKIIEKIMPKGKIVTCKQNNIILILINVE